MYTILDRPAVNGFIVAVRAGTTWHATTVAADDVDHVVRYVHGRHGYGEGAAPVTDRRGPDMVIFHGTSTHRAERAYATVLPDSPRNRRDYGVPQEAPARIVLDANGDIVTADGRTWKSA